MLDGHPWKFWLGYETVGSGTSVEQIAVHRVEGRPDLIHVEWRTLGSAEVVGVAVIQLDTSLVLLTLKFEPIASEGDRFEIAFYRIVPSRNDVRTDEAVYELAQVSNDDSFRVVNVKTGQRVARVATPDIEFAEFTKRSRQLEADLHELIETCRIHRRGMADGHVKPESLVSMPAMVGAYASWDDYKRVLSRFAERGGQAPSHLREAHERIETLWAQADAICPGQNPYAH